MESLTFLSVFISQGILGVFSMLLLLYILYVLSCPSALLK